MFRFSAVDLLLLFASAFLLLIAEFSLRVFSSRQILRFLMRERRPKKEFLLPGESQWLDRVVARLETADRNVGLKPSCLRRTLVLSWLADRCGLEAKLRFGVRRDEGQIEAHSWLECNGRVLETDPVDGSFLALQETAKAGGKRA